MASFRRFSSPCRLLILCAALLLPVPALLADEEAPSEAPQETPAPRHALIVSANDFEGMPMAGITFHAVFADSDRVETLTTSANGEAEIPDVEDPDAVTVTLEEDHFIAAVPQTHHVGAGTVLSWRLFRSDIHEMEPEEREEFARVFHHIVRNAEDASALINETGRILSRFLSGGDRGTTVPAAPEPDGEEAPGGALAIRLIDSRGAPNPGSLVQLYLYQSSTDTVTLADYERTNEEGFAVFSDLALGTYYRAEVVEDRDLIARSTIVKLESEDLVVLPTMILRPRPQILSGIIVDEEGVAAGTLVTARRPSDGLLMTAATDSAGFFLLAPFASRNEVTLTFEQSTSEGVRTGVLSARPGEGELLVPLHVLAGEGGRGKREE